MKKRINGVNEHLGVNVDKVKYAKKRKSNLDTFVSADGTSTTSKYDPVKSGAYKPLDISKYYKFLGGDDVKFIDTDAWKTKVLSMLNNISKSNPSEYGLDASIDNDNLLKNFQNIQRRADDEGKKAINTSNSLKASYKGVPWQNIFTGSEHNFLNDGKTQLSYWLGGKGGSGQWNDFYNQFSLAHVMDTLSRAYQKEDALRSEAQTKIDQHIKDEDLSAIQSDIKNSVWRSNEQKKQLQDAEKLQIDAMKKRDEEAQAAAEKQAKLDALNQQLANAKTAEEKKNISSQISALTSSVASNVGVKKGWIYIGVGMAIVVGVWITIRAIRK